MTVQNVYDRALALMYTTNTDTTDYDDYVIPIINVMLSELFDINNGILLANDGTALTSIPTVTATTDTLTYEDEITTAIMPYGLAGTLLTEDQSTYNLGTQYKNKYEEMKFNAKRGYYVDITDDYDDTDGDDE